MSDKEKLQEELKRTGGRWSATAEILHRKQQIKAKRDADIARLATFYCGRPVSL
jgi:hypothetical protein